MTARSRRLSAKSGSFGSSPAALLITLLVGRLFNNDKAAALRQRLSHKKNHWAAMMKDQCKDVALKQSLVFATYGLLAALLLTVLLFGFDGVRGLFSKLQSSISIIVAIVALYAATAILGIIAGNLICRIGRRQDFMIWIIGIGLAWGALFVSVVAGSSVLFFSEMGNSPNMSEAFEDYLAKPVFWVMLFGGIPALVLGLLYGAQVKKLMARVE